MEYKNGNAEGFMSLSSRVAPRRLRMHQTPLSSIKNRGLVLISDHSFRERSGVGSQQRVMPYVAWDLSNSLVISDDAVRYINMIVTTSGYAGMRSSRVHWISVHEFLPRILIVIIKG